MACCWTSSHKTAGDQTYRETALSSSLSSVTVSPRFYPTKIWLYSISTIWVFIPFPQTHLKLETENVPLFKMRCEWEEHSGDLSGFFAESYSGMKNWILSTHPSASAAFIKASEDTADLVPTATALKIHRDDIIFKDLFYFFSAHLFLCRISVTAGRIADVIHLFRFDKFAREVLGYQGVVQMSNILEKLKK